MDTVTYPDPAVDAALAEHFVGFKLCLLDKHPDFREATGSNPVPWAPTFRFTDGKGRETRRTVGWLGPADFVAELALARGQAAMTRGRFDDALALLEGVDDAAMAAPEARYYEGVAAFLRGKRDMAALKERWVRLRERHPHSDWANKAEVIEDWNG